MIHDGIDAVNRYFAREDWISKTPDTPLLGGGRLDSLGFVNLVTAIEERCEEVFAVTVSLTSGAVDASESDPFRSVASLTEHLQRLLTRAVDDSRSTAS